jgi:hypothetical protein
MSRLAAGATSALLLIGAGAATAPGALAAGGPPPPVLTPLVSSPTTFTVKGCYETIIPSRVSSVHIRAQGASGSPGFTDLTPNPAGRGAVVTADWAVTPGQSLFVCVDRYQGMGGDLTGFGDGGGAAWVGQAPFGYTIRPSLIAAGGGGGGSSAFVDGEAFYGHGGDAGWPGHPAGDGITDLPAGPGQGAGGQGATDAGPGAGGAKDPNTGSHVFDYVEDGAPGTNFSILGEAGEGGQGFNGDVSAPDVLRGGGAGGSGLYGGGGGGSSINGNGGPGGGGMSDCSAPATHCAYAPATDYGYGSVELTWTVDEEGTPVPDTPTPETPSSPTPTPTPTPTPSAPSTPTGTPAPTAPTVDPPVDPAPLPDLPLLPKPTATGPALPTATTATTKAVQAAWGVHLTGSTSGETSNGNAGSLPVVPTTKRGNATLPLSCPPTATGCDASGVLEIDLPTALARAAARRMTTLARFRGVEIAAGHSHLLKVKLKRSVVKRLQHEGVRVVHAVLTIDNHLDGGPSVRTVQRVAIRIPVAKAAQAKRRPAAVSPSFTG